MIACRWCASSEPTRTVEAHNAVSRLKRCCVSAFWRRYSRSRATCVWIPAVDPYPQDGWRQQIRMLAYNLVVALGHRRDVYEKLQKTLRTRG